MKTDNLSRRVTLAPVREMVIEALVDTRVPRAFLIVFAVLVVVRIPRAAVWRKCPALAFATRLMARRMAAGALTVRVVIVARATTGARHATNTVGRGAKARVVVAVVVAPLVHSGSPRIT